MERDTQYAKRDLEGNAVLLLPSARALLLKVCFWP